MNEREQLRGLLREWQRAYNQMDKPDGMPEVDFTSLRRRTHAALSTTQADKVPAECPKCKPYRDATGELVLPLCKCDKVPAAEGASELAALPFAIFPDELKALRRFYETTEDGQDYDVPVPKMKKLATIGLVRRVTGNRYEFTDFGLSVCNGDFALATPPAKLPQEAQPVAFINAVELNLLLNKSGAEPTVSAEPIDGDVPLYAAPQPARAGAVEGYRVFKDGNAWCAVGPDFVNIQESLCAFHDESPYRALELLTEAEGEAKRREFRAAATTAATGGKEGE